MDVGRGLRGTPTRVPASTHHPPASLRMGFGRRVGRDSYREQYYGTQRACFEVWRNVGRQWGTYPAGGWHYWASLARWRGDVSGGGGFGYVGCDRSIVAHCALRLYRGAGIAQAGAGRAQAEAPGSGREGCTQAGGTAGAAT